MASPKAEPRTRWRDPAGAAGRRARRRTSRLAPGPSMLHVYALCNLPSLSSPSPSPAASIRRTACPVSPRMAGRCRPSSSIPAAAPPRSAPPSGGRRKPSAPSQHHEVDARAAVFDRFVRYLIQGNVLRGEVYPLSVAAERTQQAISVIEAARAIGATRGGARLDRRRQRPGALRRGVPGARARAQIITPIREANLQRDRLDRLSRGARAAGAGQGRAPTPSIAGSGARPGVAAGPTTPGPARPTSCSSRRPTPRRRARS